jgi:hypothetical protein
MKVTLIFFGVLIGAFLLICVAAYVSGRLYRGRVISPAEVRATLERFVAGSSSGYEWDDFISLPIRDQRLEAIRQRCAALDQEFPPEQRGQYCGAGGIEVIRRFIQELS